MLEPSMIGRLLYVSDDPRTHRAISPALESVFSVVPFTSDAIRELRETEFASIVIDVDRCSSNVADLARSIRGRLEGVPIHVVVGKDWDDQLVRELGKLELLDFIIEPALPEILSQRVADHQRLRHLEQLVAGMLREKQQIGLDFADLNRNLKEAHRSNDELLGTLGHELR